jgi:predicted AAA+ superfamily ATPase
MLNLEKLTEMNHWWTSGSVKKELVPEYRRRNFQQIEKYLGMRQIIGLVGLRRTGKTTIFYQIIHDLIGKGTDPRNILYFSFDEKVEDLRDVIKIYEEEVVKRKIGAEKTYVFLDEIQKLKDWENKVKVYYDLNPGVKFFVSGSASINILLPAKESLAGRIFYFNLDVLTFEEFLAIRGKNTQKIKEIRENPNLWKSDLIMELNNYVVKPFPEIAKVEDGIAKTYIRESVIERAIFRDLRALFEVKDIELIEKLVRFVAEKPGMAINLDDMSKDMSITRQTLSNYLFYLECCLILKNVRNYRGSLRASSRKLKRYYLAHPSLALALASPETGRVMENLVCSASGARFYWRELDKEVDFILQENEKPFPVEVTYGEKAKMRDIKGLLSFMYKFEAERGLAITADDEREEKIEKKAIKFIPLWKWLIMR